MIKVLFVSPQTEVGKGGIAVFTDIFLDNSAKAGLDCDLLNIALHRARTKTGKRNFLDEYRRTRRIASDLKTKLKKNKYDVAYINTSCGTFGIARDYFIANAIKRKQPQCKIVVQFHCDVATQCFRRIAKFYLKRMARVCDNLFALNQASDRFLRETCGKASIIVPNFIEESFVRTVPKSVSETIRKALFVGSVQAQKGVYEIIELANRFPLIDFVLLGNVCESFAKIAIPDNVRMFGVKKREEIMQALDEADVFIFPTHSEGFSVALLECMARGVPSVTTDVGANLKMLENQGGRVVPVRDVDQMEQALREIMPKEVREKMSRWSVEKVKNNYTAAAVLENIAHHIRNLLNS